jgi:hypothetical protein
VIALDSRRLTVRSRAAVIDGDDTADDVVDGLDTVRVAFSMSEPLMVFGAQAAPGSPTITGCCAFSRSRLSWIVLLRTATMASPGWYESEAVPIIDESTIAMRVPDDTNTEPVSDAPTRHVDSPEANTAPAMAQVRLVVQVIR